MITLNLKYGTGLWNSAVRTKSEMYNTKGQSRNSNFQKDHEETRT